MRIKVLLILLISSITCYADSVKLSLDSCRNLAIENNKEIKIANQRVVTADYQRKQSRAAYLPGIDFEGAYAYNQKNISLFSEDQLLPTKSFNTQTGTYDYNLVIDPTTGAPMQTPDGQYIPSTVAVIPKEAMEFDIHNVFVGAVTLTQPVYMGGKISAMNKITGFAHELAEKQRNSTIEGVIYDVDAAYWQVVSLGAKRELAESYVNLLDSLHTNVELMVSEGVATRSDELSVAVKLNEAQVNLTKVENGVELSRMLLAQLCGLPIGKPFTLADEACTEYDSEMIALEYNMADVYSRRQDMQSLELAIKIYEQKQRVAMSDMLPKVAIVGAYSVSNPSVYNGFHNSFDGAFSIGAMVKIPLFHWGGNINKYKAAKSETSEHRIELDAAKEKVELQVSQAAFKTQESVKTFNMCRGNLSQAEENLRRAQVGFSEGVLTTDNVMEAQTAWLKANSETIDAAIDLQLCKVYLSKVLGTMNY